MSVPLRGSSSELSKQQLRAKRFSRVTRDVYVEGDVDLKVHARAVQLVHPEAVMCGLTAALLQNLPVDDDGLVHLCRGQLAPRSERPEWKTHRLDLEPDETFLVQGVLVTTGPRTWTDLASSLDEEALVAMGDVVLRRWGAEALDQAVRRSWGRPGVVRLRELLPRLDAGADSPAESRARIRLQKAGYTELRPGVSIVDEGGQWLASPDLADEHARVAVQHDGETHFSKGPRQRRHDVDRDELSRAVGWEVVVSTATDDLNPDRLLSRVAAAYLRAAQRHGVHVLPAHLRLRAA